MVAEPTLGADAAPTPEGAAPAAPAASPVAPSDGERDATELLLELANRVDGMSSWAGSVQGQIKALQHALTAQAERLEALATDDPAGRPLALVDGAIGYQPTPEQQASLFTAVAAWQCSATAVDKGQTARIKTRSGDEVSYRYADIGAVSEIARSAGEHGLAHFHREIVINRQSFIRTYLVHAGGGWISCDVPLLVRENNMISGLQQWASACTMARRYGLFLVLGIAVGEEDDDGAGAGAGAGVGAGAARARAAASSQPGTTRTAPPARAASTHP